MASYKSKCALCGSEICDGYTEGEDNRKYHKDCYAEMRFVYKEKFGQEFGVALPAGTIKEERLRTRRNYYSKN